MNQPTELDPRVENVQKWAKVAGTVVVGVIASWTIIFVGASIITASVVAVIALAMVNFVVPVTARAIALWRQKALTHLAEKYSEETIREDELQESERIRFLEDQYKSSRSELEGAQEELRAQVKQASEEEKAMLLTQIHTLQDIIVSAEITLKQRKTDFSELQRVNKLYIAFHRSATAMERAQGAQRDPQELQRLVTARTAIKTRMRAAMAGKTIEAMNTQSLETPSLAQVAHIGNSRPVVVNAEQIKEVDRVSSHR
jgi:hypothetical protein